MTSTPVAENPGRNLPAVKETPARRAKVERAKAQKPKTFLLETPRQNAAAKLLSLHVESSKGCKLGFANQIMLFMICKIRFLENMSSRQRIAQN